MARSQIYIAIPGVRTRAGYKRMLRRHGHKWSVEPDFMCICDDQVAQTFALHLDGTGAAGSGDMFCGPELREPEHALLNASLELGEPVFLMRTSTDAPPELGSDAASGLVTAAGFPEYVTVEDLEMYGGLPEHLVFAVMRRNPLEEPEEEEEEEDPAPRRKRRRRKKRK
jgi:hypothetical protein